MHTRVQEVWGCEERLRQLRPHSHADAGAEALQGRAKEVKGAQSATMMYSYKYTLARRAVVATFDLSAANLVALSKDHWMKNSLNIVQLQLHESIKRSK